MNLKDDPIEEVMDSLEDKIFEIKIGHNDFMGPMYETAMEFFDLVCEYTGSSRRGECSTTPIIADVELEGILDT